MDKKSDVSITNVPEFVNEWLIENNAKYDWSGEGLSVNGKPCSHQEVMDKIFIFAQKNDLNTSYSAIEPSLREWKRQAKEEAIATIRSEFAKVDKVAGEKELLKFVDVMFTGSKKSLDFEVFRHFIWQVRRSIFGLPITNHIMPVLVGKQGCGKSYAIDKLLQPFEKYGVSTKSTFKVFADTRMHNAFSKFNVIFLDEMDYVKATRIETIKNVMSSGKILHQAKYQNENLSLEKKSVFIGAANKPLNQLIYDEEMRRFYQFDVRENKNNSKEWEIIDKEINFDLILRCVDQDKESPIVDCIEHVQKIQKYYCKKGLVEEFIESCIEHDENARVRPSSFYDWFVRWNRHQGNKNYNKRKSFLEEVGELGVEKVKASTFFYRVRLKEPVDGDDLELLEQELEQRKLKKVG